MDREREFSLSQAARSLPPSVMSELAEMISRPGIISFATGLPPSEALPVDELEACARQVIERDGPSALQYGPPYSPLRDWLAEFMREKGVACRPEEVFVTTGAQQALDLLAQLFLDPGDVAVLERVTYMGFWQVVLKRGAVPRTVQTDLEHGADIEALERAFAAEPRPRLALLISDFHNPLGVSLSEAARRRVAELAAEYQVVVIEDDTYSSLRFAGGSLPPIKAFDDEGWVFYCGTFSKVVAPALRLGWTLIPQGMLKTAYGVRESLDLQSSALSQRMVTEYLDQGDLEGHLAGYRDLLRSRRDAMLAGLQDHFSDLGTWTRPEGGFFIWLELPQGPDTMALLREASERGVAFVPGNAFTSGQGAENALRLSYSNVSVEAIQEGLPRLAQVVRAGLA